MKKPLFVALALIVAASPALYFLFFYQLKPFDGPISRELETRFISAGRSFDTEVPPNTFRYVDSEGYRIVIPVDDAFAIVREPAEIATEPLADKFFRKEVEITRKVFALRGFNKNSLASSASTSDPRFYDYIEAYEKGDTLCTMEVNPDLFGYRTKEGLNKMGYHFSVFCGSGLANAKVEQKPILDALGFRNTDSSAYVLNRDGPFVEVGAGGTRGGMTVVLKKEGNTYRVLIQSQEPPHCAILEKEKIPVTVLTSIGSGTCFKADGTMQGLQ